MPTASSGPVSLSSVPIRRVLSIAFVCLGLNLAILAALAVCRPDYLKDHRLAHNPDGNNYVALGRNVWLRGYYSRCDEAPFEPDVLRTPVYPLFAAGLILVGGAGTLYLAQAVLHAGACALLFLLVQPLFGRKAATWAALFLATDLAVVTSNLEPWSETLFLFLTLAGFVCLLPAALGGGGVGRNGLPRLLAGGALLSLATLTRPVGLYLPLFVVAALLAGGWYHKRAWAALGASAAFLLAAYLPVSLWVLRNEAVCSVPRLTTVDANNMVYYVGAGAYQVRHDVSLAQAQGMIAREYHLATYQLAQNPFHTGRDVAAIDREMRAAVRPVLTKYPKELLLATGYGVLKASFSHSAGRLAGLFEREWHAPGLGALLRDQEGAARRLWDNGPVLVLAFALQMAHTFLALGLAACGAVAVLRRRELRRAGLLLLAVLAYFYLTVALFGFETYWRCRLPVLPFLFILAGVGAASLRRPAAARAATAECLTPATVLS